MLFQGLQLDIKGRKVTDDCITIARAQPRGPGKGRAAAVALTRATLFSGGSPSVPLLLCLRWLGIVSRAPHLSLEWSLTFGLAFLLWPWAAHASLCGASMPPAGWVTDRLGFQTSAWSASPCRPGVSVLGGAMFL